MPEEREIVVVGGGPAGAVFAALAARAGREVCLLERAPFPRDRVGESITVDCVKRLAALSLPSPLSASPAPWRIGAMRVSYEGGGSYLARFPEELRHFLVRRAGFDAALLEAARGEGAEVLEEGARALVVEEGRAVGLRLASGRELRARRLVVAAVGRDVGLLRGQVDYEPDPRLSIFGGRAFFRLGYELPRDQVELYVSGRDIAIVTPLEDGRLSAVFTLLSSREGRRGGGPGAEASANTSGPDGRRLTTFLRLIERFPALSEKLRGAEAEGTVEFQGQLASRAVRLRPSRLALLGNALGYSDPLLSHGVDYAVEHAERVAGLLGPERDGALDEALARYHAAARRMVWLDVGLHRLAYEVLWREALYRRVLPDGAQVSGVRLGEHAIGLLWRLAGLGAR